MALISQTHIDRLLTDIPLGYLSTTELTRDSDSGTFWYSVTPVTGDSAPVPVRPRRRRRKPKAQPEPDYSRPRRAIDL